MTQLRKCIRKALTVLLKNSLILLFKVIGPPRVLRYSGTINVAILKAFGADISEVRTTICAPVVLHNARDGYGNLTIKEGCFFNGNNFLDLSGRIILEKGVSLGPGAIIMTHNRYNYNAFLEERLAHTCGVGDVVIKEGAGIKAGVLIIQGITIGKNAVVAGNAVVNRDVADHSFVAGVPARFVKEIK